MNSVSKIIFVFSTILVLNFIGIMGWEFVIEPASVTYGESVSDRIQHIIFHMTVISFSLAAPLILALRNLTH